MLIFLKKLADLKLFNGMNTMIAISLLVVGLIHMINIPNIKSNNKPSPIGGALMLFVCLIEFMGAWIIFTI